MGSITNSQKALLIGLIGVVIAVISILYVAKPNMDDISRIKSENQTLQARLVELQGKQAKRDQYLAETEEYQGKFDDIMNSFPADLNQEISIMFLQGIKEDYEFDVTTLGLGEKEQFYTLGVGGGDAALTDGSTADATATTEATTTEATTATTETTAAADGTTDVAENTTDAGYQCYRAAFPIEYTGSYSAIKDIVSYVDTYTDRMTVDSIEIAYDAEDNLYTGKMNLMCYAIESPDRSPRSIDLDDVEVGVGNIFEGGSGSASGSDSSLNKYDENDGAAIVNSYDFYALLNPSGSDVSAKVVGQNGSGKDASVISNSDNSVSTLSFDFYEEDGKTYCKYVLDNSTSYTAEVTSAEDIKVLLQSSAKKDEEDKVGVRVTINNTSKLPVYVKVADDDASSGRVNVASKSGSVKIYK